MKRERGSVLIAVLWCLTILSVVVVGSLYSTTLHLNAAKNYEDKIQAHYLALAGIEKAKALLFHEAADRKKAAQNHSGKLYNSEELFRDIPYGRGAFSIIRPGSRDEGNRVLYGIADEESRLNINTVSQQELSKIRDLPPETIAAIIDWRDRDNNASPGGAERDYYAGLRPPYRPRNGDIQTIREMLLIRGITSALLLGEDANANRFLDPEENDGDESAPADDKDNRLQAGWSELFTVNSQVANKSAAGTDRINLQNASESELSGIPGISPEIAKAIVEWRGQSQIENLDDLLEVKQLAPQQNQNSRAGNRPQPNQPNPQNPQQQQQQQQRNPVGPSLINQDLLIDIADDVTPNGVSGKGAVNINTASLEVLYCLNGMTEELAQAVINYRSSAGFFPNTAALLKVPGMTRDVFKKISKRVTARSETFRIVSEGRVTSTGARERIEAVVRLSGTTLETVYYRENL